MRAPKYPETVQITIQNWEKYNPRRDGHKSWWFKLSNDIFMDDRFRSLSILAKTSFILLLTLASKKGSKSFLTCIQVDANLLGCTKPTQYYQALVELFGTGLVRLEKNRIEEKTKENKNSPIPTVLVNKSGDFNAQQTGTDSNESFLGDCTPRDRLKKLTDNLVCQLDMHRKRSV